MGASFPPLPISPPYHPTHPFQQAVSHLASEELCCSQFSYFGKRRKRKNLQHEAFSGQGRRKEGGGVFGTGFKASRGTRLPLPRGHEQTKTNHFNNHVIFKILPSLSQQAFSSLQAFCCMEGSFSMHFMRLSSSSSSSFSVSFLH